MAHAGMALLEREEISRGYLASLEDPQRWTSERVAPILRRLVEQLQSTANSRPLVDDDA